MTVLMIVVAILALTFIASTPREACADATDGLSRDDVPAGTETNHSLLPDAFLESAGDFGAVASQLGIEETPVSDIPRRYIEASVANEDIVAWLYVPGTNISLPIAWRQGDNEYYLLHTENGDSLGAGCLFVDSLNSPDFGDRITIVYGHSFYDAEIMLTQLHRFEDKEFFSKHRRFYVLTPDGPIAYAIAAARVQSAARIPVAIDLNNAAEIREYYDFAMDPDGATGLFVKGTISSDSRIVQLSTCTLPTAFAGLRYVVTGVQLSNDVATEEGTPWD